jgi:X-Pro dipeptidyl-peptidase
MSRSRLALGILLALATSLGTPSAGAVPGEPTGKSKPIYDRALVESVRVAMRDGEMLFVEIKRPVVPAAVRVPVILTLSPYNGLAQPTPGYLETDFGSLADFFVPRGYARAIADVRGTRESSGCWDYGGPLERHDAYDLVEWLGTRPWSNGRVGMIGVSYEGTTANAAAVERPPHLATIVPIASIDRWYDYAYVDGVRWLLNSEAVFDEGIDTPLAFDFAIAVPPPGDPRAPTWSDALADRYRPCDRVAHTDHGYDPQPDYDSFWQERDYRARAAGLRIPALFVHGLDDYNVKPTAGLEMYRRFAGPKRLVLGQWSHGGAQGTATGEWQNLLWRWFDRWLLGLDTGVTAEPPVQVQDSSGRWHMEPSWPPPGTRDIVLNLAAEGSLTPSAAATESRSFFDDPTLSEDRMARGDPAALRFLGKAVADPMRISGRPRLGLSLSSDGPTTHLAAYLADVSPDGNWTRISRGFLNPRYRNGLDRGEDLVAGVRYDVVLELMPADYALERGHRIGLAISSSNLVWAVPDERRATNTVSFGPGARTSLMLPVAPAAATLGRVIRHPPARRLPPTGVGDGWIGLAPLGAAAPIASALLSSGRRQRRFAISHSRSSSSSERSVSARPWSRA